MPQGSERDEIAVRRRTVLIMLVAVLQAYGSVWGQDHRLERIVSPFPVYDGGTELRFPFLGGFDAPRPQFVDIDGDADYDLFIQELPGALMFFRNDGTPAESDFSFVSDRYQELDVGQWYVFVDTDGDGDNDLFAEQPFGRIRLYRNRGSVAAADFTSEIDTLRAIDGSIIVAETAIPAVADVDCDGRLDLMIGRQAGTITRYESVGMDGAGNPVFGFVEDRYEGIEVVGGVRKHGVDALHGASSVTFSDIDADGDPDLIWGDFFEPNLILFRNEGTCPDPAFVRETDSLMRSGSSAVVTSGFNAPRVTDVDGDGLPDLFVGVQGGAFVSSSSSVENLYRFENEGSGFQLITERYVPVLDVGSEAAPAVTDLNADGRPDLLVGNIISPEDPTRSSVTIVESAGSALSLANADALPVQGFSAVPAPIDIDCDLDVDVAVGTFDGTISIFLASSAEGVWVLDDPAFQGIDVGSNAAPAWTDIDADGDPDLLVAEGTGTVNFFRNVGTRCQPVMELASDRFAGIDVGSRARLAPGDYDGDGDIDLFVGSENGTIRYFRNDGSAQQPAFTEGETIDTRAAGLVAPAVGDFDRDGDLDLVAGTRSGGLLYWRNDRIATNAERLRELLPSISVDSVFPNPGDGVLQIDVFLPDSRPVTMAVYDLIGRLVKSRVYERHPPGKMVLRLDVRDLPAGIYMLRVSTATMSSTERIVVVR